MQLACLGGSLGTLGPATAVNESCPSIQDQLEGGGVSCVISNAKSCGSSKCARSTV